MRRILKILLAGAVLMCLLCAGADAAQFEDAAEELAAVGIFRGTSGGFELDRTPTRSEAAIMLTRLFGAEDTANKMYAAGEISHPFTDVSAFSSPYVAWLYTQGIVKGTSTATFGASRPCTLQNYTAFLLRALGYEDGKDFRYADTLTFAREIGLSNPYIFPHGQEAGRTFLRDDLAELTWQALYMDRNGGGTWLLQSLLESDVLDAEAAAPLREKLELIRASLRGELDGSNPNPWRELTEQEKLTLERGGTLLCDYECGSSTTASAYVGEGIAPDIQWFKLYKDRNGIYRRVDRIGNGEAVPTQWLAALTDGEYPRNSSGESYGIEALSDFVGYAPDLESAVGTNGERGYIRQSEVPSPDMFLRENMDYTAAVQSYLEWEKENPGPWHIPLYDQEGSVIGECQIDQSLGPDDFGIISFMTAEEVKELVESAADNG
ncbi:MAG: S-layer homology domain-containing protein [Oscillibacter sp.]|nr:S-layer homology domain-containing protein [Oscillibacter sp.]